MGTKKHETTTANELIEFCERKGYLVVEVASDPVGDDAMHLLKRALEHGHSVSFKLQDINTGKAISRRLIVKDLEKGVFPALDTFTESTGKIRRLTIGDNELRSKPIYFPKGSDADEFTHRKDSLKG